jgi:hypothetical protein
LAQFLEKLPETQWDYCSIRYIDVDKKVVKNDIKVTCNTCACALGWCPSVFPKNFKSELEIDEIVDGRNDLFVSFKDKDGDWVDAADSYDTHEFFGLDEDTFEKLFLASDTEDFYGTSSMARVTKEKVAKKIYQIVLDKGYQLV